jgi:acetyl coenzyme A synthetase (ADP forming)-like protein
MTPEKIQEFAETARNYCVDEILRDGGSVRVRAVRPDDRERLRDSIARLSAESLYLRYFTAKRSLTEKEIDAFTQLDFVERVGLAVTLREAATEQIIGVGEYIVGPGPWDRPRAEVAFTVVDEHQGRGIGTLLLEHLAVLARARGIREFDADVLGQNRPMMSVFLRSGLPVRRTNEAGVVHLSFPTDETDDFLRLSEAREAAAAAMSVRRWLRPRSVAVAGASRNPGSIGAALLNNLRSGGFRGDIYAVNPNATEIDGVPCHPSVSAIGAPVDLVLIAVPAAQVESVIEDCARAGVCGVVVISSGFGEASAEGREAEHRLRDLVRSSGMRMVGPNCMGIINADPEISLNATFAADMPPSGNVSMLSQSGGLALAILGSPRMKEIGVASFLSVGNKADVSGNDLLAYWAQDPQTDVILLYLESFGNPRKFARLAPEVSRHKPIVAVKAGRTTAGNRAAASHTAAMANLDVAVDALFAQAGVIRTNTLEELYDVAALLSSQPIPAGNRVGVVTNAGGPGILLADACEASGLTLPELSNASQQTLRGLLPAHAGLANPIDMTAPADAEAYAKTIAVVGNDESVDAVVAMYVPPMVTEPHAIAAAIAAAAGEVPAHKPVVSVFLSAGAPVAELASGPRGRIPVYDYPENAARVLAAAERYGRWRERPRGEIWKAEPEAIERVRGVADRVAAADGAPTWLAQGDVEALLRAVGIEVVVSRQTSVEDAAAAAAELGFPLVAKAVAPGLLHKSDIGGVILDLNSAEAVADAARALRERVAASGAELQGVLLQQQVRGSAEAFVGVTTDPTFGPLVACGMGGTWVELLKDVAFRLPPVSDLDAAEMIGQLRLGKLIDGYRGQPPADRAAFEDLVQRVSGLVDITPELIELDLNPVILREPGQGAIVVDARIRFQR